MAIGTRITQRLKELSWERKDLLDKVTDLTPQALSNLIRRDSRRSEWDEAIAAALDVDIMWLVYGKPPASYVASKNVTRLTAAEPLPIPPAVQQIVDVAKSMSIEGQHVLLGRAQELASKYPMPKANHFN